MAGDHQEQLTPTALVEADAQAGQNVGCRRIRYNRKISSWFLITDRYVAGEGCGGIPGGPNRRPSPVRWSGGGLVQPVGWATDAKREKSQTPAAPWVVLPLPELMAD